VRLEFRLAGIGSRFLALAMDTLIQVAAIVGISIAATGLAVSHSLGTSRRQVWIAAILVLTYFLVIFVYFAFFEAIWNGQTPGKRWLRLRVIKLSGRPISAFDAIARNLLRIVDSIPGFYAVGIVCALLNRQSRRLGDYVAGTVVVCEPSAEWAKAISFPGLDSSPAGPLSSIDLSRLTPDEFRMVDTFLARREQLPPEIRRDLARRIAARTATKIGLPSINGADHEPLLEQVAAEYRSHARWLEGRRQ
jgi:uncharacterized RDD family membrane protein YckC